MARLELSAITRIWPTVPKIPADSRFLQRLLNSGELVGAGGRFLAYLIRLPAIRGHHFEGDGLGGRFLPKSPCTERLPIEASCKPGCRIDQEWGQIARP